MTKAEIVTKVAEKIQDFQGGGGKGPCCNHRFYCTGNKERRQSNPHWIRNIFCRKQESQEGKKPAYRQRDQDCCEEGPKIFRGSSFKGSSNRKGNCSETKSKETGSQSQKRDRSSSGGPFGPPSFFINIFLFSIYDSCASNNFFSEEKKILRENGVQGIAHHFCHLIGNDFRFQ